MHAPLSGCRSPHDPASQQFHQRLSLSTPHGESPALSPFWASAQAVPSDDPAFLLSHTLQSLLTSHRFWATQPNSRVWKPLCCVLLDHPSITPHFTLLPISSPVTHFTLSFTVACELLKGNNVCPIHHDKPVLRVMPYEELNEDINEWPQINVSSLPCFLSTQSNDCFWILHFSFIVSNFDHKRYHFIFQTLLKCMTLTDLKSILKSSADFW